LNECLFNTEENKRKFLLNHIQNESQETRLCGNERLKVDFFEPCSVKRTFGFVVVDVEEDVDDDIDGDIGLGETDNAFEIIGDGRDGIEYGVIGDDIQYVSC
jgi:hypothetical protein